MEEETKAWAKKNSWDVKCEGGGYKKHDIVLVLLKKTKDTKHREGKCGVCGLTYICDIEGMGW